MDLEKISFASDNHAGIHPDLLTAILNANHGTTNAYGGDPITEEMEKAFQLYFGSTIKSFPVFNGTAANVLSLSSLLRPHEAVICAEKAHIAVDECGAPEKIAGVKLLTLSHSKLLSGGKLNPSLIDSEIGETLNRRGDQHSVQPKLISISNTTELGAVYSVDEIRAISGYAKLNKLLLHVDGARISNAAAALNCTLKELTTDAGVDILSYGGTKNGAMGAEAVLFLSDEALKMSEAFKYIRKQNMQLQSKMRFISVQLLELLKNELWLKNATHANKMAENLEEGLKKLTHLFEFTVKREANAIFGYMNSELIEKLQPRFPFYVWSEKEGKKEVRLMTSFQTTDREVSLFLKAFSSTAP